MSENIYQALEAVRKKVESVEKERVQGVAFPVLRDEAILREVRPRLVEERILFWPIRVGEIIRSDYPASEKMMNDTLVAVTFVFHHVPSGTEVEATVLGEAGDTAAFSGPKALSNALKTALRHTLNMEIEPPASGRRSSRQGRRSTGSNGKTKTLGDYKNAAKSDPASITGKDLAAALRIAGIPVEEGKRLLESAGGSYADAILAISPPPRPQPEPNPPDTTESL